MAERKANERRREKKGEGSFCKEGGIIVIQRWPWYVELHAIAQKEKGYILIPLEGKENCIGLFVMAL